MPQQSRQHYAHGVLFLKKIVNEQKVVDAAFHVELKVPVLKSIHLALYLLKKNVFKIIGFRMLFFETSRAQPYSIYVCVLSS